MIIIDCQGSPRELGRAHGESARGQIAAALANWEKATLAGQPAGTDLSSYAQGMLSSTALIAAMERDTPDLLEEVRGIAEGAAVPFELIAAYNLMDEQWWYDLNAEAAEPGCSLVGISDGGETVLSQNMDLPGFMDGSQVVLRLHASDGMDTLVLSSAGLIGLTGVNSRGVAVCVNTLLMLRHSAAGVPVAAVMRHALAQPTLDAAERAVRQLSHASGQHYALADRHAMVGLECSAGGCAVSSPRGEAMLLHTNHPLASQDFDQRALRILEERGRVANSRERLSFLAEWQGRGPRAADVQPLLADPATPICMTATDERPSQTFGSVVFRLGDTVVADFCLGRAGTAAWQSIPFRG